LFYIVVGPCRNRIVEEAGLVEQTVLLLIWPVKVIILFAYLLETFLENGCVLAHVILKLDALEVNAFIVPLGGVFGR